MSENRLIESTKIKIKAPQYFKDAQKRKILSES